MTVALSTWPTVVVAVCAWVGACVLAVAAVLVPMGLYGRRLERRPRTVNRGHMPAHYEQVRRELLFERGLELEAANILNDEWSRVLTDEADTITREAAP